jgi:DNA polymerase-4
LNVADFAVAVERVVDARLRERPVLVAAQGGSRAAVFDMSDEAYLAGVRKGMLLRQARKFCRDARIVDPHPTHYERAMQAFSKIALPYSPLLEIGEANGHLFVDLTGTSRLHGPPPDVAWRIRKAVLSDLGLEPIWSVAPNKLVAKVATRVVKPVGEYIVEPGEEEAFLYPLPLHLLPVLERDDLLRLREFNLTRIVQAAAWSLEQLLTAFGAKGRDLYRAVRGVDDSPVLPVGRKPPSVRLEHEFDEDTNDRAVVEAVLYKLVERAGFDLRERSRAARRAVVGLEYSDGGRLLRQRADRAGTNGDAGLFGLAKGALDLAWVRRVRLRRIGLVFDRLIYPPAQLELFPEVEETKPAGGPPPELLPALDQIRRKFGANAVGWGRSRAEAA